MEEEINILPNYEIDYDNIENDDLFNMINILEDGLNDEQEHESPTSA